MTESITPMTSRQEKQLRRVVADAGDRGLDLAFDKLGLDKDAVDRLLSRGGELGSAICDAIIQMSKELSLHPYAIKLELDYDWRKFGKSLSGGTILFNNSEPKVIPIESLEIVSYLRDGEIDIPFDELGRRARGDLRASLGQRHAEVLMRNQENIPEEWRQYELVFPGTVWRQNCRRDDFVPVMQFAVTRWTIHLRFVGHWWLDKFALVRVRQ